MSALADRVAACKLILQPDPPGSYFPKRGTYPGAAGGVERTRLVEAAAVPAHDASLVRTLATCVGCHRPPLGVGTPRRVSSSAAARTLSVATCAKNLASSLARSSAAWALNVTLLTTPTQNHAMGVSGPQRRALQRTRLSKSGATRGSPAGSNGPSSFGSSYARAITLRTEVACHCPPRGALIPRAFRASAICRRDVAPLR